MARGSHQAPPGDVLAMVIRLVEEYRLVSANLRERAEKLFALETGGWRTQ